MEAYDSKSILIYNFFVLQYLLSKKNCGLLRKQELFLLDILFIFFIEKTFNFFLYCRDIKPANEDLFLCARCLHLVNLTELRGTDCFLLITGNLIRGVGEQVHITVIQTRGS